MIYIYRRAASEGADLLAEDICLLGTRARRTRGGLLNRLAAGDKVVCWGNPMPNGVPNGVTVLNNVPVVSKFTEAQQLAAAGVPTVQVSRIRPIVRQVAREPFIERAFDLPVIGRPAAGRVNPEQAQDLVNRLQEFIAAERRRRHEYDVRPAPVAEEWLPRRNNHVGGADLLQVPAEPDYYSKKENIVEEYRLHMFNGKSIRAGIKRARPARPNGQPVHPWIRSFDAGWVIAYEGFRSTEAMREVAGKAVEALGLNFGAVDLGKKADGSFIVLEVNRAPGVEGGTSEAYAKRIIKWANEGV